MSFKLPSALYTPDQLRVSAEELHALAAELRRTEGTKAAKKESELGSDPLVVLESLPAAVRRKHEAITAVAEELEQMLAHSPRVTITLAGLASHTLKEELVSWLRTNTAPNVLVSFHVNPDIAGGMVVRSTNHVYDFSFRKRLLDQPERFTRILEHV